jgi:hypothetical protein
MISANQGDSQILFRVIGQGLNEALGPIAVQTFAGRMGKRAKELESISVNFGAKVFTLSMEHGRLSAFVAIDSGGIRISSEGVQVETWVEKLRQELALEAAHSEAARLALERLALEG